MQSHVNVLTDKMKKKKSITLGTYPYAYARVTAMKSNLLKKADYEKLLKMQLSDIANYLAETEYKKEVNALGTEYSGAELLERALTQNMEATIQKLRKISDKSLLLIIDAYARRWDILNLKTIIRGKIGQEKNEKIKNLLVSAGTKPKRFFIDLIQKEKLDDVIAHTHIPSLVKAYEKAKKTNLSDVFELENKLDQIYYQELTLFLTELPKEAKWFISLVKQEIDVINIITLLRLKKEKLPMQKIMHFAIPGGDKITSAIMQRLAQVEDINDIINYLERKGYAGVIRQGFERYRKEKTLVEIEVELYRYQMSKAKTLLHKHPLSMDIILGYLFAKEIEMKNLRMLIKGKQLQVKEEILHEAIVV